MMWKNFNVNYNNNFNTNDTTAITETNMDCLMHVLTHLSVKEKANCRLVCKSWKEAIDKLFSGQKCLRIVYNRNKYYNFSRDEIKITDQTIIVTQKLKFQLFHQMMSNFPSIQTLIIQNLPLSDVMILVITTTCKQLITINFSSCISKSHYNSNDNNKNCDQITAYGWKLLIKTYPYLSYLTIKNCSLTDDDCELILIGFLRLKYLDISDNDQISGSRLNLLGETCESLCVGSLNTDLWMYPILSSISESNTQLRHLEVRGCLSQQLTQLKKLTSLESLSLKFFCPQDQIIDTLSPISKLNNLRKLRLHQERCYEEPSAIDVQSFIAIANECNHLKELVITGEYGWKLRLNDYSIQVLANKCQKLEKFSLTGNSSDITDSSVHQLVLLPRLHSVSLTSFESITDEGLIHLISRHPALDYIGIKETSSISNATLNACIEVAKSYPNRQLSIFLAETKISKPKATKLPHNLKIVFEENLRPRRQSDEPSAMKMIAVVGMSAVILAMILITMLVVIVMPVGMLLMMLYENCVEYAITNTEFQLDKDNPIDILSFFGSQAFRYLINIDFNSIVR